MPSGTALAGMAAERTGSPAKDITTLFLAWQRDGDTVAREELLARFTPLARSLARRYARSSEPFDDLMQVASLGLLKAIDRYDSARGNFPAFAVPTVLGELRRYFRDSGWSIHVPRAAQERALKVRRAEEQLTNESGRAPTVTQLAQLLEFDIEEVIDALYALQAYETVPLEAPRPGAVEDGLTRVETTGADDRGYEFVELDATVQEALRHIPARERRILQMSFHRELSQSEIGARMGISQMQVSRILRRTLGRLRTLAEGSPEGL